MCGIGGIVDLKGRRVRAAHIETMNDAQRHRGPDDWGGVLIETDAALPPRPWGPGQAPPTGDASAGLAHVRLSILDLSPGGHQPMSSADGTIWLVYNGEVYNYLELRLELEGRGHQFRSMSDTEVVLAAYEEWGVEAFGRLNGMWGLALWDARARRLVCCRDRMGIKPLYYAEVDGLFVFGSEIAGLHAVNAVPRRPDTEVVARFLAWSAMPEGRRTFFEGVHCLEPGHFLTTAQGRATRVERWWAPASRQPRLTPTEAVEGIRATLEDAVRVHLRSDVPVGVCLSGGLDSSSLTCMIRRIWSGATAPREIMAFTARFPDPGCEESQYAQQIVRDVNAKWFLVEPDASKFNAEELAGLIRRQGEPFPNLSMYAQYCVFRKMREAGVPVAINGQGADELLWGYTWHYAQVLADLARTGQPRVLAKELAGILKNNHLGSKARLLQLLGYYWIPGARGLRAALTFRSGLTRECWRLAELWHPDAARLEDLAALRMHDLFTAPLPALLRYEDRNSMAFSVESRLPFLDFRFVDLALAIPERQLIQGGWSKAPLRHAMRAIVPDAIRWRRTKLGFNAPSARLFEGLRSTLKRVYTDAPLTRNLVRPAFVLKQLAAASPLPPWAIRAFIVEYWFRECVGAGNSNCTSSPGAGAQSIAAERETAVRATKIERRGPAVL